MTCDIQKFYGVFTALVTPFDDAGHIDEVAFERLVIRQIEAGVAGLVPVGTTGEAATLSDEESDFLIRRTVEIAAGRTFVLAGTGSNNTAKAQKLARRAEDLGADGCLVVTPYYNKPGQNGLLVHYGAIAEATRLPIMLYSVPGRCGIEIAPETAAQLSEKHANIVGIKEAGGNVERVTRLRRLCGDDFIIHSGDDALTLAFMAFGAVGLTSVLSNVFPAEVVALVNAWHEGNPLKALTLHERLFEVSNAMFVESNPIPVKSALGSLGLIQNNVRAPLTRASAANAEYIRNVLAQI